MSDYVLYQQFGGLGDNLQFSTLPKIFHDMGKTFSVSKKNVLSNPEINQLVWEKNPYVSRTDSEINPNCGSMKTNKRPNHIRNIIEWNEWRHGLEPRNTNPVIYYKPNKICEVEDKTLFDLGSNTGFRRNFYSVDRVKNIVDHLISKDSIFLTSEFTISPIAKDYNHMNLMKINNIFHYCDLIFSCKKFICLYSGSSVLASCIRNKKTLCIFPDIDQKKEIYGCSYLFPNISYISCDKFFLNSRPDWRF